MTFFFTDNSACVSYHPAMPHYIDSRSFLALRDAGLPMLDARSPSEFAHGHIPGAFNLPVLDDEERAAVGTAHARSGKEAAVHVALTLTGPQLAGKLAKARRLYQEHMEKCKADDTLCKSRTILLYCWRGGMRSGALGWLLEMGGFQVTILQGGYKAYRALVHEELSQPRQLSQSQPGVLVLGGMTGSGKTDVLHQLAECGAQVIDLEKLAGHRGSAFGAVGLPDQPSNEAVENALHHQWRSLDPTRPVWLEDEDKRIGAVSLCHGFFQHIRSGALVLLEIPRSVRTARLAHDYATPEHAQALIDGINRLRHRLGDECATRCIEYIQLGKFEPAVEGVLTYYDKLYVRQLEQRPVALILASSDPLNTVSELFRWGEGLKEGH